MIVDKFKEIAARLEYHFDYGPSHWINLNDLEDDTEAEWNDRKKILLLLWKDRDFKLNEYGAIDEYKFTGEFLLTVRSKLSDGNYMFRYEEYIKRLELLIEDVFNVFDDCDGWVIYRWKESEVTNQYDTNLDGIKVSFTIHK